LPWDSEQGEPEVSPGTIRKSFGRERARSDDESEEDTKGLIRISPVRKWACGLGLTSDISSFSLSLRDGRGSVVASPSGLGIDGHSSSRPSTDKGRGHRSSLRFLLEYVNEEGPAIGGFMSICTFAFGPYGRYTMQ
jgi:hypothetical protein